MTMRFFRSKIASIVILTLVASVFSGINAFAFVTGYNGATEISGSVTDYITSSTQNDWYQFTLTESEVPTAYTITLEIPDECVYNFDLRYREATSANAPVIVSNETIVTGSRNRKMTGVFTQAGTYFVRVYSQTGDTSSLSSYKLKVTKGKNINFTLSFVSSTLPSGEATDWSVCADLIGNKIYSNHFKNSSTGRTYQNAYTFIASNYSSDSSSEYTTEKKATPEETAIAANYIYSGYLMQRPKFEVETNKIYEIEELMQYIWGYAQPVIFYLDYPQLSLDILKKYIIVKEVNIGENTITYYNPSSGNEEIVDYDEFLTNGIVYSGMNVVYSGTNIVQTVYKAENQAIHD